MTKTEIILTVIGIVNALIAALLSVLITHCLQIKAKKREDKMRILLDLMVSRIYGWTSQSVHSMNIIDIVFADSVNVKNAWHRFFDLCKVKDPSEQQLKDMEIARYKLIEEIANNLGYKDKLTWDEIQSCYMPQGMVDNLKNQQNFQNMQLQICKMMTMQAQNRSNNENNEE